MHGTLEQLRDRNPGKWLLVRLDGPEKEAGTLIAAHEDARHVEGEMEKRFRSRDMADRPLYVTYSIPEGQELPTFAL